MAVTTMDIAKKLGISRGTVSRVINNHSTVKEETRVRILEELKKSGYTPNEAARSLVMKRKYKIAVVVFSEPEFFWKQVKQGVDSAGMELKVSGVSVDYFITDILDPESQLQLIRELPGRGYNAIAVASNDPYLLMEEIDTLSSNGTPVLLINVDIPSANRLCYVGCDYTQAGKLAADILVKFMKGNGQVAILTLSDPIVTIAQRVSGFRSELSHYPDIQIGPISRFNRKADGVYEEVCRLLEQEPQLTGVYVSFGALEKTAKAVGDCGLARRISVVGYDLNDEIYNCLKEGTVSATICHEPFNQGYFAVKFLYQYLNSGKIPLNSILYTKLEVVLATNAEYYLNEQRQMMLFHL